MSAQDEKPQKNDRAETPGVRPLEEFRAEIKERSSAGTDKTNNVRSEKTEKAEESKKTETPETLPSAAQRDIPEISKNLSEELESPRDLKVAQLKWALKLRMKTYGRIALAVLGVVLFLFLFGNFFHYKNYKILASLEEAGSTATKYLYVKDSVLTYDSEGATLLDLKLQQIWTVQYKLNQPAVSTSGEAVAIYDEQGSSIVLCDGKGQTGTITTSYPLIKAKVSSFGSVAAVEADGEVTRVEYFNPDGTKVASLRTSMDSTGYPLDVAVSSDGLLMAVSFLSLQGSDKVGVLEFYQFGAAGQNQVDNRVARFEYRDHFFPQIEFPNRKSCIAFRDNGFSSFTADDVPEKIKDVLIEDPITSVAFNANDVALLTDDKKEERKDEKSADTENQNGKLVSLYEPEGRLIRKIHTEGSYNTVTLADNELDFFSDKHCTVYSTGGLRKFDGWFEENTSDVFSAGNYRFGFVSDGKLHMVRLR